MEITAVVKTRPRWGAAVSSMLSFESPGLDSIAANLHVAPTARVIFAGIQKEPAALIVPARSKPFHFFRCDQSCSLQ